MPIPFAELPFGALEAKAVDGQRKTVCGDLSSKMFRCRSTSARPAVYGTNIILVSQRWDKLSPAEQKMMRDARQRAVIAPGRSRRRRRRQSPRRVENEGMRLQRAGSGRAGAHAPVVKPVTDKFAASYDATLVKLYNDELAHPQMEVPDPARAEPQSVRPPRSPHLRHHYIGADQRAAAVAGGRARC